MSDVATIRDRARFVPPTLLPQTVGRARLDKVYDNAAGQIVRVLAPGGYGKSTQVARWVTADTRDARWVDLERVDNDPLVLLGTLGRSLTGLVELSGDPFVRPPADAEAFRTTVVPAFSELVRRCADPFVLVLDDLHHVDGTASSSLVDALAASLPTPSTLILSGRSQPRDEAIARLRLRPGVVDVTVADLAFDIEETRELVGAMGITLEPGDVHGLAARFEGWPAGLRLAALALVAGGEPPAPAVAEVDNASFVVEYLRAEWTGHLNEHDRDLLREAAVLGRFTGDMCDEILGRQGSAQDLRRLHHNQLLLLPLDRRDAWFRMHPLLGGWLESEQRAIDRERWHDIHARAARFWENEGDIDLAVTHAVRIDEIVLCEALVRDHGPTYFSQGLHATVREWLGNFSHEQVRSSNALSGLSAILALHANDGAGAVNWYNSLARSIEKRGGDGFESPMFDTLQALFEQTAAAELIPTAERARDMLNGGAWQSLADMALGGLLFLNGDDRALAILSEGAFEAKLAGAQLLEGSCLAAAAIIYEFQGDFERANENARAARALLANHSLETLPTTVLVTATYALVDARAGRRDSAMQHIAVSRRQLGGFEGLAPWVNAMSRYALVRAAVLAGDGPASQVLFAELQRALRFEIDASGPHPLAEALRPVVEAAQRVGNESSSLTAAELKVLKLLPTNLSLGDIAKQLFVSRNTVKTHTAAIYRKLGTTSRSRAVELARQAGMLDAAPKLE